ncbi:MAG: S-adenosylmethionine:tRNA ribosyltransferase-isomerase [bacterium]
MKTLHEPLTFDLPDELAANEPPEARGIARDGVRLMVSYTSDDAIIHTRFSHLPDYLESGDVLVVNTSATISAALDAVRHTHDGPVNDVMLHLSAPLSDHRWVVELRRLAHKTNGPLLDANVGEHLTLPGGGEATLIEPYIAASQEVSTRHVRLWVAELRVPGDVMAYIARHGLPIRYGYVPREWPLAFYQTVFAREPGSAEMPSAGRAFTRATLEGLSEKGVRIAPLVLHTGVSSLEADEPPYPERYRVPEATAQLVNAARETGGRIVAVGTTAVRALETVVSDDGRVVAGSGWTDLVISPERELRVVDAMLTGFHPPKASHLWMLSALAGRDHLALAYEAAVQHRYRWHEFGDLHLILTDR